VICIDVTVTDSVVCNAALHKPTYQISVDTSTSDDVHPAYLANDGTHMSSITTGSCAATQLEENAWWVVDLGIPMTVKFVRLTTTSHGKDVPIDSNLVNGYTLVQLCILTGLVIDFLVFLIYSW